MSRARRAARMEAQRLRGMGAQQEMVRQCRREVRDGPTMQTGGRRWQMLPQSTTLFIRMSPPPNSQEYLMDELRSEAINRGACGPQGAASLPGECPPAAPDLYQTQPTPKYSKPFRHAGFTDCPPPDTHRGGSHIPPPLREILARISGV